MSEKGIKVSGRTCEVLSVCRNAAEISESSYPRVIPRVDVCKGKLWDGTRPVAPTASLETGNVSISLTDIDAALSDIITVGDDSTLTVFAEFLYNWTQQASVIPVVLAKDTDDVIGVLEEKSFEMVVGKAPNVGGDSTVTEDAFDIRADGYVGDAVQATALLEENWGSITLLPGDPFVHTKMKFDTFMVFPFTIEAGTYTFVYRSGTQTAPSTFYLDLTFHSLDGTVISPTLVNGYNFNDQTGSWASYTFAEAGTYLVCFDGDYQTLDFDDVLLCIITGDMGYHEETLVANFPLLPEQKHDNVAVRYDLNADAYIAIRVNIVEAGTYKFTLNNAELAAGVGDLTGYLLDTDRLTNLVDDYDDDTPNSNWEVFSYAITVPGVYIVVVREYNGENCTVDVTIENTTGTSTGELIGPEWFGASMPPIEGAEGRFLVPCKTWDVSGAYRLGLIISELDAGVNDSKINIWGTTI